MNKTIEAQLKSLLTMIQFNVDFYRESGDAYYLGKAFGYSNSARIFRRYMSTEQFARWEKLREQVCQLREEQHANSTRAIR